MQGDVARVQTDRVDVVGAFNFSYWVFKTRPDMLRYFRRVRQALVTDGVFFQIMAVIYRYLETPGAAFPSSHVAVAWCTVWFSFRYLRQIRWIHAVMAVLLSLSTIYCRYHYVVDVFAGIATAALLVPLGDRLHRRFARDRDQMARS